LELLSVICGLLLAGDSIEVLLLGLLGPLLKASSWEVTTSSVSLLQATIFIGELIGSLTIGPLSDHYGRRPTALVSSALIFTAGLGTAFVGSFWLLVGLRIFVGVGVGGLSVR